MVVNERKVFERNRAEAHAIMSLMQGQERDFRATVASSEQTLAETRRLLIRLRQEHTGFGQ